MAQPRSQSVARTQSRRCPRWSEAEARRRLEAFSTSGLSAARWCAAQGVSRSRLQYWSAKLASPPELRETAAQPSPLVAVRLRDERPQLESAPTWPLEIIVGDQLRLRIGAGASADLIQGALRAAVEVMGC